jgi:predicted DNA binding protein
MGLIVDAYINHPNLALTGTIESVSEMSIHVVPHSATDPETGLFFFRVTDGDFAAFESSLAADPTVEESSLIIESEIARVYRLRHTPDTELLSPKAARVGGLMLEARSHDRGWIVRLQLPDRQALSDIWEYCEERGMAFELERLYQQGDWESEGATGLTAAQREALLTAYDEGYFEEPRETSQGEVADRLGISSTAAGGRIRRGIAKLIETTLDEPGSGDHREVL